MNRKIILISAALTSFMTAFMSSALNIALPQIGKEFNINAVTISWTSTAYLLASASLLIPAGKLSDIYGRILFFKVGLIIFSVGTIICGISDSGFALIAARIIQGAGASLIFATSTALVVSAYPPTERGKVIGINTASVYIGLSSGPFLGGLIASYLGWRYIFFLTFAIGVALIIMILAKVKEEWKNEHKESLDIPGSILLSVSLIVLMLGFSFLPGMKGFLLITVSLILFYIFFIIEKRSTAPVLNFNLFITNKTFTFSNIAALINYSATSAVGFLMSFYLQTVKGMSPKEAGIILITQPVMMAVFSPLSGKISDKTEPQLVASIGMGMISACLLLFAFLTEGFSNLVIIIILAVLGIGFALFSSPNSNAVMGSVEKKYYGIASSSLAAMRNIGQMFSMGIVIIIFSIFIGDRQITSAVKDSFLASARAAFLLFSVLCFFGIFASISRGKIHHD